MSKIYFLSYFEKLITGDRNAPLACNSISLYIKELLEKQKNRQCVFVNLAPNKKPFCFEKNLKLGNMVQIGTRSFGKIFRKFIWSRTYWKHVYSFLEKTVTNDDIIIIYHSLYNRHLISKVKKTIKCKVILVGAELYSSVSHKKSHYKLEVESYSHANGHILISEQLRKSLKVERPYVIISGNYSTNKSKLSKFGVSDGKIHLVYSGIFDSIKGGLSNAVYSLEYLPSNYVLHIAGFGDDSIVQNFLKNPIFKDRIIYEGKLIGEKFDNLLARCDIGLSTQNIQDSFNKTSFPSKILSYLRNGLQVVSTPSISVIDSNFKNAVYLTKSDSPSDIAETIKETKDANTNSAPLDSINQETFVSFTKLLDTITKSKRFIFVNNSLYGSTGNLCKSLVEYFYKTGNDCLLLYKNGSDVTNNVSYIRYGSDFERFASAFLTRITGNCYGYMRHTTKSVMRKIHNFKPDIVNVHCVNSYSLNVTRFLGNLKSQNIPTIITNHALFFGTGSCGYPFGNCGKYKTKCGNCPKPRYACKSILFDRTRQNWLSFYKTISDSKFIMVSVSPYVRNTLLDSPITKNLENYVVLNGIDTSCFCYGESRKRDGKIHILYVNSAIKNTNKGFYEFKKIVEKLKNEYEFVFHVAANESMGLEEFENVVLHKGISNKHEMAKLYQNSDLTILTSRRETFSLPLTESLCCGTPIVSYKCGGPESFLSGQAVKFYEFGDFEHMVQFIKSKEYLLIDRRKASMEYSKQFSLERMCQEYDRIFTKYLNYGK